MAQPVKTKDQNYSPVDELPVTSHKHYALTGWPMILGWLAMIIFALHACTHMVGAGDTWVAMACGRHFIDHGVNTVEPFSANSHKAGPTEEEIETWPGWAQKIANKVGMKTVKFWHPTGWINQNWLTHVMFYWLTTLSPFADAENLSFNTLVYWKFAIYIITVICVYYTGRLLGVNPALSAVFACFAMFTGRALLDIRPAGFSNLLVAVFLLILVLATYRNILYIWLIVPLTVFWCNVHGGYLYVFIMLVPFVFLNLLTSISKKRFVSIGLKGVYHAIAAGFVALVAAIVFNPFHLTNFTHTFIISFSKHAKMWRSVNEWHPAFAWQNPVGTGFPFLILFILGIGLTFFWLFSRFLLPKLLKAPKNELEAQEKLFNVLSKIFGCIAAVFICWVTFISFSFVEADMTGFLLCTLFVGILLLSIYKSVHYIYLAIGLTLLAVWSGNADAGYSGRYIYPFVILPGYLILHIVASLFSKAVKFKPRDIAFVALSAVVSLLLMILVFNPFKFEMPFSNAVNQFLELRRPWNSKYERNIGITYEYLFDVLYILNICTIIIWLAIPYLQRLFGMLPDKVREDSQTNQYELPKIDLSLMAIAALTIYMAYRSRRFIPIAGIAACPVIAMLIDQMIRTVSAAHNFHKHCFLSVSQMSYKLQLFCILVAAITIVALGTGWGFKFKRVYLDSWPGDLKLSSVFMRMTASDAKPFDACNFIRDNKLKGNMFNYWTEGGFIAWGQEPDPNTGRTPLQLFMDGRAQAAYQPEVYQIWSGIMSGGPAVQRAAIRRIAPDYAEVGLWINKQLEKYDVWVVLLPMTDLSVYRGPFLKGLGRNPNWNLVFVDDRQRLFVDITTPQGKELFDGILNGKTLYTDEFAKNIMMAHRMLSFADMAAKKQGFDFAVKAFELRPSQISMQMILSTTKYAELQPLVSDFCKNYFDDFTKNKKLYAEQDGYLYRIWAALLAGRYLRGEAVEQGNNELVQFYIAKVEEYQNEQEPLQQKKRW
ncbi:MAG: hypothetical protein PHY02_10295 [Phycisphaerae bacterium]|nr:hypothetical protein [Phycisphaerae bacterium]